jgi:hypothetical protein
MRATAFLFLAGAFAVGCGGDSNDVADAATDADTDTDSDTDSDSDGDACDNPEVQQDGTSLFWLRCPIGQCLVDDVCQWAADQDAGAGEAEKYSWEDAAAVCPDPYRLPTVHELGGLLGGCDDFLVDENTPVQCDACPDSAACAAIYPEIAANGNLAWENLHWSSTEMNVTNAWRANFKSGILEPFSMSTDATVVCLREE